MKKEITKKWIKEKIFFLKKRGWIFVALFLIISFLTLLVDFYSGLRYKKISDTFFSVVPVPIAKINGGKFIFSKSLIKNNEAVKNFYESQDFSAIGMRVDFRTEEGKLRMKIKEKEVLDKLIEDAIVVKIANEKGIEITEKESEKELKSKINEAGDSLANFALNIKKIYNWKLGDFRKEIVHPQLYMKEVFNYYEENLKQQPVAYEKIKEAELKINGNNSNFEDIAKEYSQGSSAKNGGKLGWFTREQLVPEVADVAFKVNPGERSSIITSSLGFHIIFIEEVKKSKNEKTIEEVKLKQIFTQDGGFLEWLVNKKKETNVSILMQDYVWNKLEGQIDFKDEEMRKAEEKIKIKSEGDPTM